MALRDWFTRSSPSLANPSADMFALFGAFGTVAGENVNFRTAMRCTPVAAAVRAISEPMGALSFHVYKRHEDGSKERDRSHPVHRLLHGQANPWTGAGDLRTQLTVDALCHGNGFALVVRDADDVPRELHRLSPEAISIETDSGEPVYVQRSEVGNVYYPWQDILHLRAPISFDGIKGESPISLAREAIALSMAMERHGSGLFGNGARPAGVLEHPGKLSEPAFASLTAGWAKAFSGNKSGGTAILEEGMSFKPLTFNSVDAQFLELRRFAVDEIARAFGVPPHLIYEMGRATWGNSAEMGQSFATYSLLGWIMRWEAAVRRALFKEEERATHFAELNLDALLRADFTTRSEGIAKQIASRVLSPNEARAMEGRAPYDGGDVFANPATSSGPAE